MKQLLFCILIIAWLASCQDDGKQSRYTTGDLNVPLTADAWTFVSLETGSVVGSCLQNDSLALADWHERLDWDVAFSPDGHIRTNSGLSGKGKGGIVSTSAAFDVVDVAPESDYVIDNDTVDVW